MKNGNLYKIAAFMMALVLVSALGFAQEETKKEKKSYVIKMEIDDDGKTTTIDVSSLAAGVYFIEVETNEGKGVNRFIKQ